MSQYRLHIDIPMPFSEEEALKISSMIINFLSTTSLIENTNITEINYRLGHDDDRQKSNYFIKNENGHVNNKKLKINIESNKKLDYLSELDEEMGLS
jgi:hypothetical protein